MTENQLKYLAHQENVRHNLANEGISSANLEETARSNRVKEGISQSSLNETVRSNMANEGFKERSVAIDEAMLPYQQDLSTAQKNAANAKSLESTAKASEGWIKLIEALVPG